MTKIYIIFSICLLFLSHWCVAQKTTMEDREESEQTFGFASDYENTAKGINAEEGNTLSLNRVWFNADSCRLLGDTKNAEYWYKELLKKSKKPIHKLQYALSLQANGKYEQAKEWFLMYDEAIRTTSESLATRIKAPRNIQLEKECDKAAKLTNTKKVTITKLAEINSKGIDFSPIFYENGIVFASSRTKQKRSFFGKKFADKNVMDLFFTEIKEDGALGETVAFSKKINSKLHEGPLTFAKDQKTIYFTRNNRKLWNRERDSKGRVNLKIYSAEFNEKQKDWKNIKELSFNNNNTTMCHPTISPDGKYLYFASDKEGGYGGMDLYVSEWKNDKWNEPINLGKKINTKRNEAFPFLHDDGTLYFASNRPNGYGRLDIYFAQMRIINDSIVWTEAKNMGQPINSERDDFGFIVNLTKTTGFLSSNRKGSKGDDIYALTLPTNYLNTIENKGFGVKVGLYDEVTKQAIVDAKLTIIQEWADASETEKSSKRKFVVTTDYKGAATYYVKPNYRYTIQIEKEGYYIKDRVFTARMPLLKENMKTNVPLLSDDQTKLSGRVVNQRYQTQLSYAKLTLVNQTTGERKYLRTNEEGEFETCLPCNSNYVLFGIRKYFGEGFQEIPLKGKACQAKNELTLELPPNDIKNIEREKAITASIWATTQKDLENTEAEERMMASSLAKKNIELNLEEGLILELNKMSYENEERFRAELDKLVELLEIFPSMELEIAVHTDARGNDKYNYEMSQNKANDAVDYIVSKGIAANRIIGKGYGEQELKNNCQEENDCTKERHSVNRRMEIKITKFDEAKWVKVRYLR